MGTFEKVQAILVNQFQKDSEEITLEKSFREDMDVDSLEFVEIMMQIEEEFEMTVDDSVAENLKTIQDLVNFIDNNKN